MAIYDVVEELGNTWLRSQDTGVIVGAIDPETGAVSDAYISPEGMPFPSEENYRVARQEYEDYLANGGDLSFQEWLTEGRPEASDAGTVLFAEDYAEHIIFRDLSVSRRRGIGGAHNSDEFFTYSDEFRVVEIIPHPTVIGIQRVRYQMAALDPAGNPTGEYRARVFEKTIYDPNVISNEQMLQWGREAAAQAHANGALSREWIGVSENGIQFRGYLNDSGAVRSFFPNF